MNCSSAAGSGAGGKDGKSMKKVKRLITLLLSLALLMTAVPVQAEENDGTGSENATAVQKIQPEQGTQTGGETQPEQTGVMKESPVPERIYPTVDLPEPQIYEVEGEIPQTRAFAAGAEYSTEAELYQLLESDVKDALLSGETQVNVSQYGIDLSYKLYALAYYSPYLGMDMNIRAYYSGNQYVYLALENNMTVEETKDYLEMAKVTEIVDEDSIKWLENESITLNKKIEEEETLILLNGEYDKNDAVLEIHSGAGGTEACDWADMLYRMYSRYTEKKNYKLEVIDKQMGLEAGIKSITLIIKGLYAYGYLKNEKGIHRLVRISPFDSGARRHTSFASVSVTPVIDDTVKVDINEKDLKIDVFHSSGAGGQSVNTTDSAVRITHLPTGIVVTCQNERSQVQNKAKAMQILKSKLYEIEEENKRNELKELKGEQKDINFGSQIRSYVMHPYSLVKDHRTNIEETNVNKVMDGDIDKFISANLRKNRE